jgi:hypothetical protein
MGGEGKCVVDGKTTYDLHCRRPVLQQLPEGLWAVRTARHAARHADNSDSIVSTRILSRGSLGMRAHRSGIVNRDAYVRGFLGRGFDSLCIYPSMPAQLPRRRPCAWPLCVTFYRDHKMLNFLLIR